MLDLVESAQEGFSLIIETRVYTDPIQPCKEGGFGFEIIEPLECLEEDILRRILRITGIAEHVTAEVEDPVLVFPDEILECRRIAVSESRQQIDVIEFLHLR